MSTPITTTTGVIIAQAYQCRDPGTSAPALEDAAVPGPDALEHGLGRGLAADELLVALQQRVEQQAALGDPLARDLLVDGRLEQPHLGGVADLRVRRLARGQEAEF